MFPKPDPSFRRVSQEQVKNGSEDLDLTSVGDFTGNGTVMRVAPIGVFFRNDYEKLINAAKEDANITHNHPDARDASTCLSLIISDLLNGKDLLSTISSSITNIKYEYDHVRRSIVNASSIVINNHSSNLDKVATILGVRGTAHETLATAIYCFITTDNFKDCVVTACLLGGDADTRAALAGSLAGTYYGLENIPNYYIDELEDCNIIMELDKKLIGA